MIHTRKLSFVALLLGALALGAVLGSGCAIHQGDRSTVQPLALSKAQFTGTWYYQKTAIKAPYDAVGVFPGSTNSGYKIRWEVTERYLYAFTTQPNVRNADSTVAPVAAWPIIGHFTVRYMINYSTGQPSNIVGEDYRDKPWYQRPHFRVAWGRSSITDFSSYDWLYAMFGYSRAINERAGTNVRPEQVRIMKDYMDFVTEEIQTPGIWATIGKLNQGLPATSYRIKYRYAFRKAPEKPTYTPVTMTDDQFQKFGFFRTTILKYNIDRGLVDWSYQYLANRHNVATKAELDSYAANNTPEAEQKPKQIVYYLSPNFPAEHLSTAHQIIAEWNKAFQRATNRGDDVIVLRANDHNLPKGQSREMGDIRYRFLYWVPEAISFGLLGYGPSFADYDTGEIISSAAYVYGATVRRVANRFLLLYDMVAGNYTDEDIRNGKDYLDIINNYTNGTTNKPLTMANGSGIMAPSYKGFDIKKAHKFVQSPVFNQLNAKAQNITRTAIQARLSIIDHHPSLKWALLPDEYLRSQFPTVDIPQLKALDADNGNKVLNEYLHPINLMRAGNMRKLMNDGAQFGLHNMMLANYVDPALSKFVQANKNRSRAELQDLMTKMIFLGTEAHEIGHTLGLRHNFEGSADDKNYFPKYYELKDREGGTTPGTDNHNEHRWFYMYSSIMDYHGEVYGDGAGIGQYDHAAIMYGYGRVIELDSTTGVSSVGILDDFLKQVADKAKADPQYKGIYKSIEVTQNKLKYENRGGFSGKINVFDATQVLLQVQGVREDGTKETIIRLNADDLTGHQALRDIHAKYGVAPVGTRFYQDGTPFIQDTIVPLKRKFYRFCSDELVGQSPYCARFDSGSNPREIVENMIRRYDGSYPISNWNRGRRNYRLTGGYLYRRIQQFSTISLFYQNWMFRVINEDGFQGTQEYFDQLAAIQRGVAFVNRIIHMPEPGRHVLDQSTNTYIQSAKAGSDTVSIPIGVGRYFYSQLQDDEIGLAQYRFKRIGVMYDKYVALMTLAIRDWGLAQNAVNFFFINFADYFSRDDVTDLFTEAIGGQFAKKYSFTHKDKTIDSSWHPVLQYSSMYMAMAMLNNFMFGNTFSHYMTVGIQGNGSAWTPPPGREKDVISFSNASGTRSYFAVQTQDGRSIAYKLVARGQALAKKVKELRALPTSAVNQAELQDTLGKLVFMETVLQQMYSYTNAFFE
jgi:predicted Zn-dependent protease